MATKGLHTKRALIDKANSTVVLLTSIAAFVTVFSLVATKTLISQASYQNRVLKAQHVAVNRLKSDLTASDQLKTSYDAFIGTNQNVLGGNPTGTGPQDGNNQQIVLDALPSSYDFPALATSLEKIITGTNGLSISSISGTDDEVNQSSNQSSATPQAVPIPFQLSVTGGYQSIQTLIGTFEHSIRPFQIQTLEISGDQNNLTLNVGAQTFYQPAKTFNTVDKVVD